MFCTVIVVHKDVRLIVKTLIERIIVIIVLSYQLCRNMSEHQVNVGLSERICFWRRFLTVITRVLYH